MIKRDRTGTPTERALVRMLMESTGTNFMDSGGQFGRQWQRNQATGMWRAADWLATPELQVDGGWSSTVDEATGVETTDDAWPVLSLFHYLRQRLEFDSQLTAWLVREGNRHPDRMWLADMEEFAQARHEADRDAYWGLGGDNTYNRETLLSQDLQYDQFTYRDTPYVAVSIHNGADARGGYTSPKVFAVTTDEPWSLFDWDQWSFGHTAEHTDSQEPLPGLPALPAPEEHVWDKESGSSDGWVESGGTYVRLVDYAAYGHLSEGGKSLVWERRDGGSWVPRCPIDGAPCEVYAPTAW